MNQRTVVVVDDAPMVGTLLRTLLSLPSVAVQAVTTLAGLRERLAVGGVDLVILDHQLANGEGLSVMAELKAAGAAVIVLTGYMHVGHTYRAAGADHVVLKPFRVDQLVAMVAETLG